VLSVQAVIETTDPRMSDAIRSRSRRGGSRGRSTPQISSSRGIAQIDCQCDHDVADSTEAADVLLCDGDCRSAEARPFVTLAVPTLVKQGARVRADANPN